MPLETAAYVNQLNPSYPLVGDLLASTYQHLDLIKNVLVTTFPNLNAAVTGTPAGLNAASTAFSGGACVIPANGTSGAEIILSPPGPTVGSTFIQTASGGLKIVAQGPTPSGGTAPAPITELSTDGSGDVTVDNNLTAGGTIAATVGNFTTLEVGGYPLIPTGIVCQWYGSAASIPAGWALCNGANGTPDLRNKFVVGAGPTTDGVSQYTPGTAGGAAAVALSSANLPAHNHTVNDPGHNHSLNDPGHNHGIADYGHTHGVNDPTHGHNANSIQQVRAGGAGNYWNVLCDGSAAASGGAGTNPGTVDGQGINFAATNISIQAAGTGIGTVTATTRASVNVSGTGITTQNTGGGVSFSTLPPFYALCFIMKL